MRWLYFELYLSAVAALALSGCTATWVKPGASASDYQRARAECEYEVGKASPGTNNPVHDGWREGSLLAQCMNLKGWVRQ
jgi:hypothetical protein